MMQMMQWRRFLFYLKIQNEHFFHESLTKLKELGENTAGELIITNWIMTVKVKKYGT